MSKRWYAGFVAVLVGLALPFGASADASPAESAQQADRSDRADRDGKQNRSGKKLGPGDERKASVVKHGWWWAANEPPPETGLIAAPQPPTPTTPKGSLPVGAVAGEPEKVSALEVRLAARPGSTVRSFDMVLRESAEPGANVNAETARILACPVDELFWADGSGAAWNDQPAYDCKTASAVGKRNAEGVWRFDLTAIAAGWLAEGNTDSRSVVLVEDVDAPEGFQIALDGQKAEGIGLALKATPPAPVPDPATDPGTTSGSTGSGVSSGGGSSTGTGSSSGGGAIGGGGQPAVVGSGPEPKAADAPQAAAPDGEKEVGMVPVAATPAWYSGIPRAGLLLLPFALGLAYLIMLSLGPDGRPLPTTGRHGVSRALDRLRQAARTPGGAR